MHALTVQVAGGVGRRGLRPALRRSRRALGLDRGRRRRHRRRAAGVRRARRRSAAAAGAGRASAPCSPTKAAATAAAAALAAQRRRPRRADRGDRAGRRADWVRLTQAQFGPTEIDARLLDRADLVRAVACGRAPRDPARPGPGVRHRHPPDHPDVPALDRPPGCGPSRALAARARLRLRLGHPGDRRRRCSARRDRRRRHRPGRGRGDRRQRARPTAWRCTPARPTPRQRQLRPGAGQHPGDAAQAARAAALRPRSRPAGTLVLAGILERQADELQAAYAPWLALEVARPATTAGS